MTADPFAQALQAVSKRVQDGDDYLRSLHLVLAYIDGWSENAPSEQYTLVREVVAQAVAVAVGAGS